jgi:glycosyltransferase involved in cell wall biosynthesis
VRIALIGRFRARPDEGMRKLCGLFEEAARQRHEVLSIQTTDFCGGRAWSALRHFRPRCLHYVTGPTVFGLAALKLHQVLLPGRVTTVATGLRPDLGRIGRGVLTGLAPDVYLAQARCWEDLFAAAGSRIVHLPNPVDTACFAPITPARKRALRARWGMESALPVALHVGHVRENRGLESLIVVQGSGCFQVWIVGSESMSQPGRLRTRLEQAGCRVCTRFVPRIEEIYQAADIYVFTVPPRPLGTFRAVGVIDFPLSVLEGLACGLPIVTTRHDALVRFLGTVPGLAWFDGSGQDCLRSLESLGAQPRPIPCRARQFGVPRFCRRLNKIYDSIERDGNSEGHSTPPAKQPSASPSNPVSRPCSQ